MFDCNCALCGTFISSDSQQRTGKSDIVSVYTMVDDRRFWYGLSGVMEFIEPPPGLKKDDEICNVCMEGHKGNVREMRSVKCQNCGELHQPCWHTRLDRQGWGCAADVYERDGQLFVSGGWGSGYDDSTLRFTSPVVKPGGELCDKCIDAFLEEGSLVRD